MRGGTTARCARVSLGCALVLALLQLAPLGRRYAPGLIAPVPAFDADPCELSCTLGGGAEPGLSSARMLRLPAQTSVLVYQPRRGGGGTGVARCRLSAGLLQLPRGVGGLATAVEGVAARDRTGGDAGVVEE